MPPDWDLGQIAIFQLATHLEGIIKTAAINGPCGGDAAELTRLVKEKTVRVVKNKGVDFYFFPSVNIDRTQVYEKGDETEDVKAITTGEKDEIDKGMDEVEDGMMKAMGLDEKLLDGAMSSSSLQLADEKKVDMGVIRDTCKVDACKLKVTIKLLKKVVGRAETVDTADESEEMTDAIAKAVEHMEAAERLSVHMQFFGDYGKAMDGDTEFDVSMSDTWHADSSRIDKSMHSCTSILNALIPKKASSPKKKGKQVKGRGRGKSRK